MQTLKYTVSQKKMDNPEMQFYKLSNRWDRERDIMHMYIKLSTFLTNFDFCD